MNVRFAGALLAVAVGGAAFAVTFRSSLALVYMSVYGGASVVEAVTRLPSWLRVLVPTLGGFAAGLIARLKPARRQNVSNVMEAVALGHVQLSMRATALRVAASWAAIVTGMSIGREGPLIEFGGSLGAFAGRVARCSREQLRVLVAAGTAAGFAAAYNTPFAAVLFVLETVVGIAAPVAVLPAIAATVVASALTRAVVGGGPIYGQRFFACGPRGSGGVLRAWPSSVLSLRTSSSGHCCLPKRYSSGTRWRSHGARRSEACLSGWSRWPFRWSLVTATNR